MSNDSSCYAFLNSLSNSNLLIILSPSSPVELIVLQKEIIKDLIHLFGEFLSINRCVVSIALHLLI